MSESKYKELLQHLDSIGWSPDRYGDAQCVDVGSAMAADAIRSLESEIEQAYICLTFAGIVRPVSLADGIRMLRETKDVLYDEVLLLKRDIEALSKSKRDPDADSEIEPQRKAREWKRPE